MHAEVAQETFERGEVRVLVAHVGEFNQTDLVGGGDVVAGLPGGERFRVWADCVGVGDGAAKVGADIAVRGGENASGSKGDGSGRLPLGSVTVRGRVVGTRGGSGGGGSGVSSHGGF